MASESRYVYGLKPEKTVVEGHGRRTAENTCGYMLPTLLQKVQENPGLRLLDVGCGPGSITVGLAKYIPNGHLVGVDLSAAVLESATKLAQDQCTTNLTFQEGNIYSLPFEDGAFDVVHTHQIIIHCAEPVNAIRELRRVTRKGGIVCMKEADTHTVRFWPEMPVLQEVFETGALLMSRTGAGFSDAGRRLKAWTVEAGIPREQIQYTASAWCHDTPEARRGFDGGRMLRGSTGDKAVELGIVTRERLAQYEAAWKEWENDEDGVMLMLNGEVVATV